MEKITNDVLIVGRIESKFIFSHEAYGEKFYDFTVSTARKSGKIDLIPARVPEVLIDPSQDMTGERALIGGQFRSCNIYDSEGEKSHLRLYVFCREITRADADMEDDDRIQLIGYVCKEPVYRETPRGREVTDVMLAVSRPLGRSDYIPIVMWGRTARYADLLEVGAKIIVCGRIQSREYFKETENGRETRTAYEVSAKRYEEIEEDKMEGQHED